MGAVLFKSGQQILSTRTDRTVGTNYKMALPTLSIRKERQWVLLCLSQIINIEI